MSFSSFGMESHTEESIHQRVREMLASEPKGTLLDLGAGTGALAKKLQSDGFKVHACDLSGKHFIPQDIPFSEVNLNERMPYEDGTFDLVTGTEVIEHLENPWHLLRELYRITRPGGVVVLSTPNLHNWYVRSFFLLSSKLYNFMSSYEKIGHITPVYLWNLERMAEKKFALVKVDVNESKIPGLELRLPFRNLFFGQCLVVKMRRLDGAAPEKRSWYS